MNKKYIIIPSLIFIILLFGIYFRVYPVHLPVVDSWAQSTIVNLYKMEIEKDIKYNFPNLDSNIVKQKVNEKFNDYYLEHKKQIDTEINIVAKNYRGRMRDVTGHTYLLAIDPYHYFRMTRNYIERGYAGEYLSNNVSMTRYQLAPSETELKANFHVVFQSFIYKTVRFFNKSITLNKLSSVIFYTPIIVICLSLIAMFFLLKKCTGIIGAFFGSLLLALNGGVLVRTIGGFSDTDPYNILFPILILLCLVIAYNKKYLWTFFMSGILGVIVGLYSWAWNGWWYMFDFIIIALICYMICIIIRNPKTFYKNIYFQKSLIILVTFFVVAFIVVSSFHYVGYFFRMPVSVLSFTQIKDAVKPTLWPNVYTTVAELSGGTLPLIIEKVGGKTGGALFFIFSLLGIASLTWKRKQFKKMDYSIMISSGVMLFLIVILGKYGVLNIYFIIAMIILLMGFNIGVLLYQKRKIDVNILICIFLTIWFIASLYASIKGIRFTLLLVPPFVIGIGLIINKMINILYKSLSKLFSVNQKFVIGILIFILCVIFILPIQVAHNISMSQIPSMNDAWFDSLTEIKYNSSQNAIISSWWDFGHWFISVGNRGATSDGAHQNTPQAHWLGKLLLSNNETVSIGILRMLNCDGNNAYNKLYNKTNDTILSIDILNSILGSNYNDSYDTLAKLNYNKRDVKYILESTHCIPPESFLITSEDMVAKAGVWAHFGNWDFKKAEIWNLVKLSNKDNAINTIKNNLNYTNIESMKLYYMLNDYNERQGNSWISSFSDKDAIDESLFINLFYFDGNNTKYFKKFSDKKTLFNQRIIVWKVDWDKYLGDYE
jgi:dolichyl-phosphooligosaccharide-protein glycotransferase